MCETCREFTRKTISVTRASVTLGVGKTLEWPGLDRLRPFAFRTAKFIGGGGKEVGGEIRTLQARALRRREFDRDGFLGKILSHRVMRRFDRRVAVLTRCHVQGRSYTSGQVVALPSPLACVLIAAGAADGDSHAISYRLRSGEKIIVHQRASRAPAVRAALELKTEDAPLLIDPWGKKESVFRSIKTRKE